MNGSVNTVARIFTWRLAPCPPQASISLPNVGLSLQKMAVRRVPCLLARRIPPKCARPAFALSAPSRSLATAKPPRSLSESLDTFPNRHIGPEDQDVAHMLARLGYDTLDAFVADAVPPKIRILADEVNIAALSESQLLNRARELAEKNTPVKSYIGMGYHNAVVPPVILRNVRILFISPSALKLIACSGYGESCMVHPLYSVPARDFARCVKAISCHSV